MKILAKILVLAVMASVLAIATDAYATGGIIDFVCEHGSSHNDTCSCEVYDTLIPEFDACGDDQACADEIEAKKSAGYKCCFDHMAMCQGEKADCLKDSWKFWIPDRLRPPECMAQFDECYEGYVDKGCIPEPIDECAEGVEACLQACGEAAIAGATESGALETYLNARAESMERVHERLTEGAPYSSFLEGVELIFAEEEYSTLFDSATGYWFDGAGVIGLREKHHEGVKEYMVAIKVLRKDLNLDVAPVVGAAEQCIESCTSKCGMDTLEELEGLYDACRGHIDGVFDSCFESPDPDCNDNCYAQASDEYLKCRQAGGDDALCDYKNYVLMEACNFACDLIDEPVLAPCDATVSILKKGCDVIRNMMMDMM